MNKGKNIVGIAVLFLAAIIWGFAFSAQKIAADNGMGSFTFNGIRFLIGGISLIPVILLFDKEKFCWSNFKHSLFPGMLAGTVLFIASNLQQIAIDRSDSVGKISFITGLYIVFVPIAALILFGKKTGPTVWIGALLSIVGLYFLSVTPGERIASADILALVGTFFWTAHILTIDRFIGNASPLKFSMVQFFTSGTLAMIVAFIFETVTFSSIKLSILPILYTGVLSSGVAYTCQTIGQKRTDPSLATIILSSEALFGALSGVLINGEKMSNKMMLGSALMFAGIIISQIVIKKKVK